MSKFKQLGVANWLSESLLAMKITTPTDIQKACIPKILQNYDCIGGAKTGSGKTIAFAAPILSTWSEDPSAIYGVVLTPTRELALQIAEQFTALGASMNIRVSVIVGGEDIVKQALELQNKPHFVIATPGRLADHITNSGDDTICGLRRVKYLVLDEADRLLSNSFGDDLEKCFSILPSSDKRQTLLFTATVTDAVKALKDRPISKNKKQIFVHEVESLDKVRIPPSLSMYYFLVPSDGLKEAYLHNLLVNENYLEKSAIIFVNRTRTAEILRRILRLLELTVVSLHSEMPQSERVNSLHRFKAGAARILIATDVASRGLDIPTVELVVNYDIPADPDDFIHRVGRTARAGRKGDSISMIAPNDIQRIISIESKVNKKMTITKTVTDDSVIQSSLNKTTRAKRECILDMENENFGEKKRINKYKHELNLKSKTSKTFKKTKRSKKSKRS
ncbi:ATP-dependent RNA helicase DBP8 [Ascoidea rubescens DSM 1968]|uniref:RNA helicase n=1 Tax=Ascoidea rubescens DSM 1968 TaxID=1344418 RepID=A0A1D2VPU2_9ASCO|nr:ATP-dependent RNA helicase DBP8 [Ascoidea rubescens DSM 1968]ODV63642.1 ATP-dependent RNA helicase DBP8 [Ascoidea rubescens DSM 1968]